MVKLLKVSIINLFIFTFISCWSSPTVDLDMIKLNYDQGVDFYNKKKYSKAKESFKYVILHSMGSRLALESEFYLSESMYNLAEYEEALYGYDNYARSSQNIELIELSRFRLCQCAYNLTVDYKKDQHGTNDAIEKIEIFLEDYPNSKYYFEVLSIKSELEYRLAKKEYESAILYMKLEYKAALIYLLDVINNHMPLESYQLSDNQLNEYNELLKELLDNTRIMIIYSYLLDERIDMAEEFYKIQSNNFYNSNSQDKAVKLLNVTELSKLNTWKDIYWGISR